MNKEEFMRQWRQHFTWTYLSTHEQAWDLGPYFMKKPNNKEK